jgi:hypothetical protein
MAMGGVHHQQVHAGLDEGSHPLRRVAAGAHGGAHPQGAPGILGGEGVVLGLLEILGGDHALELVALVHHQHFFDAVLVQQLQHFFLVGALAHRDQPLLGGHHAGHRRVHAGLEAQIAVGDDAHRLAVVHHRHAGNVALLGESQHLAHREAGRHGNGISHHAALVFLDLHHLPGLLLGAHVLVDDAHAAFLGQGDGQTGLGHRVHGGRQQRNVQLDFPAHAAAEAGVAGQQGRIGRLQEHVVEGEGVLDDAHGKRGKATGRKWYAGRVSA